MDLLRRVLDHINKKGLFKTVIVSGYRLFDYYFDLKYHTDTADSISLVNLFIPSGNKARGYSYQPTMALPFSKLMRKIPFPVESVLVDFGCGKGRVLMLAALNGIHKSIGIEFAPELCDVAKKNIKTLEKKLGKKLDITVIEADVTNYQIKDDENIFFFANPFDGVILDEVSKNILKSLENHNRKIFIIYYNPVHSGVLEGHFLLREKITLSTEEYFLYANH